MQPKWSREDSEKVILLYSNLDLTLEEVLAHFPNRTMGALTARASILGVNRLHLHEARLKEMLK